jgi:hypothetical protein
MLVATIAATITVAWAASLANDVEQLSPRLAKTLIDQIWVATASGQLWPDGGQFAPAALMFIWLAPVTGLLAVSYHAMLPLLGAPAAIATVLAVQFAAFQAGAPALTALALRRGLSRRVAVGLGILYAISPAALNKLSWDVVAPGAPLIVFAELARARGAWRWGTAAFVAAAWCHPFAGIGPIVWTLMRARRAPAGPERRREVLVAAVVAGAVLVSWTGIVALSLQPSGGSWIDYGTMGRFARMAANGQVAELGLSLARNALGVAALLGTAGFLLLRRPVLLVPLAFDLLYGLLTPQGVHEHGLVAATVGLLFVLTIEAMVTAPSRRPRLERAALVGAGALCVGLLWGWSDRAILRQLGASVPPPHATALSALDAVLRGRPCVVSPSLVPFFVNRCATVAPYAYYERLADVTRPGTAVVLAPARVLPRDRSWGMTSPDVLEWERSHAALLRIAEVARSGGLTVLHASDDVIVLAMGAGTAADDRLLARLDALAGP